MTSEVVAKVKDKIEGLLKAGFIRKTHYVQWLANVVPVLKKNGKLKVCIDFRDLNTATPKDEYPMPMADMLKNAGATYQRGMNLIFHDKIGQFLEVYIDDVVVKSMNQDEHLGHLRKYFERMRWHGLKMNPLMCSFGVSIGNFLGFLIHQKGIEVDRNKTKAIMQTLAPQNKELQKFLGQAFEELKRYLIEPPVLMSPQKGMPLKLEEIRAHRETLFGTILHLYQTQALLVTHDSVCSLPNRRYQKSVKGQALADFLTMHPPLELGEESTDVGVNTIERSPWKLFFDGSRTSASSGAGIVLVSLVGMETRLTFQLCFPCTNNQAEYDALLIGLKLSAIGVKNVEIIGNSQLVIKHLAKEYRCESQALLPYFSMTQQCLDNFDDTSDCIRYAKGCQACQRHTPMQGVPTTQLHPIAKPWPFRGWALDLIGKVTPPLAQGHTFVIVATDYFTTWVEAIPMKSINQADVIRFLKLEIIHRFGLLETLTNDNGSIFFGGEGNSQAEASNKVIKINLSKVFNDNPRSWAEVLLEVLWAFRTSKRTATGTTPYVLTFGQDTVLPMELTVKSLRVARQYKLTPLEYSDSMIAELENLDKERLLALDLIQAQKVKVAKAYNKRVKPKAFTESDLVLKAVMPIGRRDPKYRKWSPTWEGPFLVHQVLKGGAYHLRTLDGQVQLRLLNDKYLKQYHPTMWEAKVIDF
ncbi:uncharacterized protein LOC122659543 [Telopea speciosissima]|uniref:uncharacterized protein LOC122659543 n=1 Tax=Telopea speciosissima TaxID=54955 RepID=UPI001CC55ABD|nr:uncharacterized protein LOC122659543 [Telopea speciosissima]